MINTFKLFFVMLILTALASCAKSTSKLTDASDKDFVFKDVKGCFLLYNLKTKTFDKVINEANCHERFPACSSFKVPLAVMAFDSGILKDENVVLSWDGKRGFRPEEKHDHNAKTWMRDSVVWFSQDITPKLGKKKLQKYLADFNYGNQNLSEGITTAWLTSPSKGNKGLNISAYEQVEFMKKLWSDALPVSPRSMEITRKITYLETSPKGFKLSGKTGSNFYDKEKKFHLGWFIAHIQKDGQEYIAVTNISDLKPYPKPGYGGPRAKQMTKEILATEGLW